MSSKAYCIIYGEYFSPTRVEEKTGLKFSNKNERGDIGKIGRYKNLTIPYGSAELESDIDDDYICQSHHILDILQSHIDIIKIEGATNIVLHIDYLYETQCNLEFDVEIIARLTELSIPLTISCFESE